MESRAARAHFRDNLRSLLYMSIWDRTCNAAEGALINYHVASGLPVPADPFGIIKESASKWAAVLDDFIAPVVCIELSTRADAATRSAANLQQQRQMYRDVFLVPKQDTTGRRSGGGGLTEWVRHVPEKYSFLMELMNGCMEHVLGNLRICLERLLKDRQQLATLTPQGTIPGAVAEVIQTGSDSHCGGQVVIILRMADGYKLVYKPMGGQPALIYTGIVQALNQHTLMAANPIPYVPVVVPDQEEAVTGNQYHWAAFIARDSCRTQEEIKTFYNSAGALVALASLLGFSDGHLENVLAAGARPHIIDCETFFQPCLSHQAHNPLQRVLGTALLQREPHAYSSSDGAWMAAFQHVPTTTSASHSFVVLNERTVLMQLVYDVPDSQHMSAAVPLLDAEPALLKDYIRDFEEGFRRACVAWEAMSEDTTMQALLKQATDCPVRYVARATAFYVQCLRLLQQPSALSSRAAAETALRKALDAAPHAPLGGSTQVDSEVRDMLAFDVPAFYIRSGNPTVWIDSHGTRVTTLVSTTTTTDKTTDKPFKVAVDIQQHCKPPPDGIIKPVRDVTATPLDTLDTSLLIDQDPVLYSSVGHQSIGFPMSPISPWDPSAVTATDLLNHVLPVLKLDILPKNPLKDQAVDRSSVLRCALDMASDVVMALFGTQPPASALQRDNLYHGLAGILVFLAGVSKVQPGNAVIQGACERIVQGLTLNRQQTPSHLGGLKGAASDAYGLAIAGQLAGNRAWAEAGRKLYLEQVNLERIGEDKVLDVTRGVAGCALVGIAVHSVLSRMSRDDPGEETQKQQDAQQQETQLQERLRTLVAACGERLLNTVQRDSRGALVGWPTQTLVGAGVVVPESSAGEASGFAHGLSGFVLALRRLYAFTGDAQYLSLAQETAVAENKLFDSASGTYAVNHMHHQHIQQPACSRAWCWGLPGVILSRCGGPSSHRLPLPDCVDFKDVLLPGKDEEVKLGADFSMCCGLAGRIDVLLEVSMDHAAATPATAKVVRLMAGVEVVHMELGEEGEGVGGDLKAQVTQVIKSLIKVYAKIGSGSFKAQDKCGYMSGMSGLGYVLLRSLYPESYPCVLALGC